MLVWCAVDLKQPTAQVLHAPPFLLEDFIQRNLYVTCVSPDNYPKVYAIIASFNFEQLNSVAASVNNYKQDIYQKN